MKWTKYQQNTEEFPDQKKKEQFKRQKKTQKMLLPNPENFNFHFYGLRGEQE